MTTRLLPDVPRTHVERLRRANRAFQQRYPGDAGCRQPVHTVYGDAHLFAADSASKLGAVAIRALDEYAPDFATFGRALGLPGAGALPESPAEVSRLAAELARAPRQRQPEGAPALMHAVYTRVLAKLRSEPVEDFRIDFEDGYGVRDDSEEDGHARSAAAEVARGLAAATLPPFIGIRVKPLTEELRDRSARTLTLWSRGRVVLKTKVAVGRPGMETPLGLFYVTWRFVPTAQVLGKFAFETSAYSRLSDWPGGGIVGIHGTYAPSLLGQAVSHGCVRVGNRDIVRMRKFVGLGTPIQIVA